MAAHKLSRGACAALQEIDPLLKWADVDEEGLVKFLVGEKNFSEDRVRKTVAKIKAAKGKVRWERRRRRRKRRRRN